MTDERGQIAVTDPADNRAPRSMRGLVLVATGIVIGAGLSAALFGGLATSGAGSAGTAAGNPVPGVSGADELAAILVGGNGRAAPAPAMAPAGKVASVDVMIARLQARLADTPDDAEGWRMLGWSLTHLGRRDEAIRAYRRATELAPGDPVIATALQEALAPRPRERVAAVPTPATPSAVPTGHPGQPPEASSRIERWALQIRSWAYVGDLVRARQALADAMQDFAGDPRSRAAIARMAESYGVRAE